MAYLFNTMEKQLLSAIDRSLYMQPSLAKVQQFVQTQPSTPQGWQDVLDHIHRILLASKDEVEHILETRKAQGTIKDIRQAMKSIAGNTFSNLMIYILLYNKLVGNVRPDIFITNKKSHIKGFDDIATIYVDGETQKPDVDLIIFTQKANKQVDQAIILSLKTSLRERAGQTYKWKLLMEVAASDNDVKKKYAINYPSQKPPLVCFATVNFYNEINNPQHRGMFKFFDRSFIAKPINEHFIASLSTLVDFVNEKL